DIGPEGVERALGLVAAAAAHAVGEHRGVHRAGRGAGDRFDLDALVLEQPVEHAPGVGAVRAAALEGKIDALRLHGSLPLRSVRGPAAIHGRLFGWFFSRTSATTRSGGMPWALAWSSICFSSRGVRTYPGQMALQVIPSSAVSSAVTLVSPS